MTMYIQPKKNLLMYFQEIETMGMKMTDHFENNVLSMETLFMKQFDKNFTYLHVSLFLNNIFTVQTDSKGCLF